LTKAFGETLKRQKTQNQKNRNRQGLTVRKDHRTLCDLMCLAWFILFEKWHFFHQVNRKEFHLWHTITRALITYISCPRAFGMNIMMRWIVQHPYNPPPPTLTSLL